MRRKTKIFLLNLTEKEILLTRLKIFLLILRNDKYFNDLQFNLLTYSPETIIKGKKVRWSDGDDSQARCYIEEFHKMHNQAKVR